MKTTRIKRGRILRNGAFFCSLGILLMLFDANYVRLIGSVEFFIGSLSIIIYNAEKYKYLKLLKISFLQKGYNISFKKQRLVCLLICLAMFFCNAFSWGYLLYLGIISKLVFNIIGIVFILLLLPLLPVVYSTDNIEKLADEASDKLIDLIKNHEQK